MDLTSAETVATVAQPLPGNVEDEGRFAPGTLVNGRYRISGLLGRGGMGEVYRATDLTLGQPVALKFLPESAGGNVRILERFHSEVRVARQVSHPNVCRVYDIGEVSGAPFISMEYVDGEDLSSLLQRIGRLPADKALEISRKLCAGLAAAHDKGIIHRDLKPQNIMLNKRGEVVIMDFGLAAAADSLTGAEARNGTPAYMSPEQLKGLEVTAKSDIYSLGVVLYELFTGRRPYDARTVQSMIDMQESQQLTSMTSLAADMDPAAERVIKRCLDPDASKRPTSPLGVAAALPGGDPLAAALAAGETLSPEAVANAGSNAGMDRKWALVCLVVIVACLALKIVYNDRWTTLMQARLEYPPDALRLKGREMVTSLGYPVKPADHWLGFFNRPALLKLFESKVRKREDWNAWYAAEAPISAHYRESQQDLVAMDFGFVTPSNPPNNEPGTVALELDAHGRLRGFSGVPYLSSKGSPSAPVEPEAVFRAAELDITKFEEKEPNSLPRTATDRIRSWKGMHPSLPDVPMTLEIGWWKNQVTWVKVIWPWMNASGGTSGGGIEWLRAIRFWMLVTWWVAGTILAILLARRNWKLGRVDTAGAAKLALAMCLLGIPMWIGRVHPVQSGMMFDFLYMYFAQNLIGCLIVWLLYLALEPTIRARWPQSVITWNRLLAGRFGDAQVASHILIGAALGMSIWIVASYISPHMNTPTLFPMLGARQWLEMLPGIIQGSLRFGLVILFALFWLRSVLKKDWLAAPAGALLFGLIDWSVSSGGANWLSAYSVQVFAYSALAFVLLRFGLVTTLSCLIFLDLMGDLVLGSDLSVWHASYGLATLAMMLTLVFLAFWKSLGNRDLLDGSEGQV
jgi:aminoglycoside phosphotransferase (APT) family kinase protein